MDSSKFSDKCINESVPPTLAFRNLFFTNQDSSAEERSLSTIKTHKSKKTSKSHSNSIFQSNVSYPLSILKNSNSGLSNGLVIHSATVKSKGKTEYHRSNEELTKPIYFSLNNIHFKYSSFFKCIAANFN